MKKYIEMIVAFSNASGAPGFEDEVVAVARRFAPEGLNLSEDRMRNFYLRRPENSGKPVVMLDAHSDEVGFMVQCVKPDGTLRFAPLGRIVECNIPAHRVRVHAADGRYVPGVVATKPPHFLSEAERKALPAIENMSIDIGALDAKDAREGYGIRVAAPVVPDVTFTYDEARDTMIGKAFDCRLGCASILATLDSLRGEDLGVDVIGAMATQEEVGTRGAYVTANAVRPDVAIVFEGCPADDTVVEPYMVQTAIRKGPMLRHIDALMITHPRFQRYALDTAQRKGIPAQEAVRTGGATNGAPIHLSNLGVPCIVIGIPVRYIHSHYGIAAYCDFENGVRLAAEIIRSLNADVLAGF
jgi:putative aminopeptidase FrvX